MSEEIHDQGGDSVALPVRKTLVVAIENVVRPAPAPCTLLDAITALALNADINGSAPSLIRAGYALMLRVKPKYAGIIANIISDPDPVGHMQRFVKGIPEHILRMDPATPR